jgi:hypothetical protein
MPIQGVLSAEYHGTIKISPSVNLQTMQSCANGQSASLKHLLYKASERLRNQLPERESVLEGRNYTAGQPTRIHGRKSARGVSFRLFNDSLLPAKARKVRPASDRMITNS